jgi:osmoprotectant transport system permease protein
VSYALSYPWDILRLLGEHLAIVAGGVLLSVAIAVPLGIVIDRWRALEVPVLTITGLLYVVPSLALFAALIPYTGLGKGTAIAAQVVYSLLVITRNTAAGLRAIPAQIREAEVGLGLSGLHKLWLVDVLCALPVIIGGIRVAAVMGVGIAAIAAYVGAGGLGTLVFRGIATLDSDLILAGVIPITAIALAIDAGLRRLEARLTR